jgi:hypothetical protein
MARVTVDDVKEIFETNMGEGPMNAFITSAAVMVNNGPALVAITPALSEDELFELERWIAAHLAAIRDPIALRQKIGDSDAWHFPAAVTTAWSRGLGLTPYGQQALLIDRTGFLANAGKAKGSFRAAPRENSSSFTDGLTTE